MRKRLGMIGYGAIGREIGRTLKRRDPDVELTAVLVRTGRTACPYPAVHDMTSLLRNAPSLVLECAGHAAVAAYAPIALERGADVVLTSVGVLADQAVLDSLRAASHGGGRLLFAAGAVAGLDGLAAARWAGLKSVVYTSFKPPHAWRGTTAETIVDLDHPEEERVFFEGSARDAALAYPKNANVAVAVGLCGLGLDRTQARLVSSRRVEDPVGVIEADGDFGHMRFEIFARAAPANPKTSLLTAYSLLQCAALGNGLPVFDLIDDR